MTETTKSLRRIAAAGVLAALVAAGPAAAFDSGRDAQNRAKSGERASEHQAPAYQAELRSRSAQNIADATTLQAGDPERNFAMDVCFSLASGCAGDIRLYDFEKRGRGIVRPVLWTARNGSTVSSHVWATRSGPAKRPGIVITNGSIQAPEPMYWWAAQTLAKAGYVVVTFDPQQQGRSDTYGEGGDAAEGVPSQTEGNTFFDWTQDAIDFLLSAPPKRFCARPSRSGTSHCAKQNRRVREGRNAAFNPLWKLVDGSRIGVAGHSYGAAGVSWIGQQDPRVDAVVAWDNLCAPTEVAGTGDGPGAGPCLSGGQGKPPGFRVPSLGITNDSTTGTESRSSDPDPTERSRASLAFSKAGVDTGSIVIRGGTHFEYSYLPSTAFRATLRGIDLAAWYTTAWFDKYVKRDPSANARLLTSRWRSDPGDRAIDPAGKGNLYSFYYRSRLDIGPAKGRRFRCEDLRSGRCDLAPDCDPAAKYSYLAITTSQDRPRPVVDCPVALAGSGKRCLPRRVGVSSRRIGPARLGRNYRAFFRRHRAIRRDGSATRFCVRGGGQFVVWRRRGKIDMVATTARGHRTGRLGPRRRLPARASAGRRIRGNLFVRRGAGHGRVVYRTRGGRVRFLAVVRRRALQRENTLVRRLRAAGLR